jgi:flagellar hook assembly protein FlgD
MTVPPIYTADQSLGHALVRTLQRDGSGLGGQDMIWDGTDNQGREVASGSYFLVVRGGALTTTKKIIVIK